MTFLPSRSFSELIVNENLLISNSTFGTVKSGAFLIHNPNRFEVTDSNFDILEGEAFRVTTRGDVLFKDVHFNSSYSSVFLGISVNLAETSIRKTITFNTPVFESFDKDALRINTTSFDLRLVNVCIKMSCDCNSMNSVFMDIEQPEELYCLEQESYINYVEFRSRSCILFASNATIIIAVGVALILIVIMGGVLWCFFKKAYRCDKYGGADKKKKLSMIVPDGRTYRETELHVIVERTDLLTTDL
ncbi:sodium/chloride dependent transporter [Holotrichia oblita]|uniref:Haloacid dehalogenase-like hydrolase n=2 Tax=Holotrichia oblita TaxID=644536 RepID=A0ACB9TWP6_HOLOL|nr:haloacid dehalogenase-like hydrolase [Holotrichia oblita]KAI4471283.1 sodium/chloride dependent transporter [Holotrichia oblita]